MDSIEQLTALRTALRCLLDIVESGADEQRTRLAWQVCERRFAELGDLDAYVRQLSSEGRSLLEDIRRLDALVRDSVLRQQSSIQEALRITREARRSSSYYVPEGRTGRSCDIAG
jgi:hypothetical protein